MSSSASRQSKCVDKDNRANAGAGPDRNRPPQSAVGLSGLEPEVLVMGLMIADLSPLG